MSELLEQCGHGDCEFNGRAKYCPVLGAGEDGDAGVVIGLLDETAYDFDASTHGITMTVDRYGSVFERRFTYSELLEPNDDSVGIETLDTVVEVRHVANRQGDSHGIFICRYIGETILSAIMYSIHVSPAGSVRARVEEVVPVLGGSDRLSEGIETRRMVPYDYERLFDELVAADELQTQHHSSLVLP